MSTPQVVRSELSLERFDPLGRILTYDTFDAGFNGWTSLCGNHDGRIESVRPLYRDLRPPQLSSVDFFDIGTHGAMTGRTALKLATRAVPHSSAVGIRRLTMRRPGLVRVEAYLTYKAETRLPEPGTDWDGNADPSELDFASFTLSNDVCLPTGERCHMAIRYQNTDAEGNLVQRWRYKTALQPTTKRLLSDAGSAAATDMHTVNPEDWQDLPGEAQPLCYNEVPTKVNWHYLSWTFDTGAGRMVELVLNDRHYDLSTVTVPFFPEKYHALPGLLNLLLDVQTLRPVRNVLYVDSVLTSVDW